MSYTMQDKPINMSKMQWKGMIKDLNRGLRPDEIAPAKRRKSEFAERLAALKRDPEFAQANEDVLTALAHGVTLTMRE